MHSLRCKILSVSGLWLLLIGLCTGCSSNSSPNASASHADSTTVATAVSVPDSARYVGDATCASCHADAASAHEGTGHGQSVSDFDPETAPEQFTDSSVVYHEGSDLYYEPFVRKGTLFQREFRQGPAGDTVHKRVHEVDLVIGSGNATRSYMMEVNDYYTEMPITWYANREEWDMSPGYGGENGRFSRQINITCMNCHTGRPDRSRFTQNHYPEVPENISCERCHGPGETHVERQKSESASVKASSPAIVTPTDLPREEELSVCQQCHLAGVPVFGPGEDPTTFRPGEPLRANRTVYVPDNQLEDPDWMGIDSHPIRLARSACFEQSSMTCTTCHNAHTSASSQSTASYNNTCRSCHGGSRSKEPVCSRPSASPDEVMTGNCVSCHMEKGGTSDVPHVTFTDHWIRENPDPREPSGQPTAFTSSEAFQLVPLRRMEALDGSTPPASNRANVELTIAYFRFYEGMHRHPKYIERAISHGREARFPDPNSDGPIALARALSEADSVAEAAKVMRSAVKTVDDAWAHYWNGVMAEAQNHTETAIAAYQKALELQPKMLEAQVKLAGALFRRGRIDAAQRRLETIVELNPVYSPQSWFNLGVTRLKNGRPSLAREAFSQTVRLDPDLAQGHVELGRLASENNRHGAAAEHFRRAIAVDSTHVQAYGSLGIVYVRMNQPSRARRMFEKVLELDPDNQAARRILKRLSR